VSWILNGQIGACDVHALSEEVIFHVGGKIVDGATRDLLNGPPEHWIETLRRFALELGFDTFVFWPEDEPLVQLERFAEDVVPVPRR
jgi:hypothetical protein